MARVGASKKKKSRRATELSQLKKELKRVAEQLESRDREQIATSEVLRVIASSSTDLQSLLDVVAENAARLCEAKDALIFRIDGDFSQRVARYGLMPGATERGRRPITRETPIGRAILDRQIVHVHDLKAEIGTQFADSETIVEAAGTRTVLAIPLLREENAIGAIAVRRQQVEPFSDKQIALLKTFADQAAIAIENARLFQELKESLEQQTATSEILGVIASSPTDIQPVLDVVAENAARLCDAKDSVIFRLDGDVLRPSAIHGPVPLPPSEIPLNRGWPVCRAVIERQTIHVPDIAAEYREAHQLQQLTGTRAALATPLLREGVPVGAIIILRVEARRFSEKQIALLETFADQAVIAIENVRLFNELKEALVQQTATSEILGVIASSPTEIQPVLDAVAKNAARLCEATDAQIRLVEGNMLRRVARYGPIPGSVALETPIDRGSVTGRAVADCETIHVHDLLEEQAEFPEGNKRATADGIRTALATPLLRGGVSIGVIFIRRQEVCPFTDKQIALVKTFADQAVIAIENVRLFKEIQERNAELREALEHQTATSEVLGIISRSPTDVQPVLDAIVESAARVCGIDDVGLRLREGNNLVSRAHFGPIPPGRAEISLDSPNPRWLREHGTLHIPDVNERNDLESGTISGSRTFLFVPLRQKGEIVGSLSARRIEVRPFTPAQIKLLETFADQAVIAIENVRLFNELKESLEQQTATSEILGVIASSPTDIQPVLDAIAESAARVCNADDASIRIVEGNILRLMTHKGSIPFLVTPELPITRGSAAGRAVIDHELIHIEDLRTSLLFNRIEFPDAQVAI